MNAASGSGTTGLRLSRRRALVGGAAAALALGLGGCDLGGDYSRAPTPEAPRRGGTLRTGTSLPLSYGLDPHVEAATGLAIVPRVYGYLMHVDPRDESLIHDHAEQVEQPDDTTYIFTLRNGLTFHDVAPAFGRAVTAHDVARSIERYRDNPLVVNKAWHTTVLDTVWAPDDRTVIVTTREPNVYSLHELGGLSSGAIIPVEAIDADLDLASGSAGSGPFVAERVDFGTGVRIASNAAYHRDGIPYLDAMEWALFDSDADKMAALQQRRVDIAPHRDKTEAEEARAFSDDLNVSSEESLSYLSIGLRVDRAPFNDLRVRQAIDVCINRDELIRNIAAGDGDVLGPVNPHMASGYWSLPESEIVAAWQGGLSIDDRRTEARRLLDAAGVSSATITLQVADLPQLRDVASVIADQLGRVGLTVVVQPRDLFAWFVAFRRGEFEATLISHQPYETPDVPTRLYESGGIDGSGNVFGFLDPAIDALVERSWIEADREARLETLLAAQRLMIEARPMVHLFTGVGYSSAWPYVRDRQPELIGSRAQYNYEQWLALPAEGRPA